MIQRIMRNYCENEENPLWHTHKVLWEKGSGRSTLSGENCGQTSSQQLNITVLVVLGVIERFRFDYHYHYRYLK